ncbi:calcium-binding and coiled-coil domain-containing protein 1 isoform X3 [Gadus morhua]|uniref:calcium-binding and coiled-coil domain-containing protein 1 isoform X3 n=1 Tax=Gadus morhua TaxID=8049 RepID=UPI0011B6BB8F|nr:calcium-binding and coiled-coil domain-containing protein 1 isoform X3 [Gadus morhua]
MAQRAPQTGITVPPCFRVAMETAWLVEFQNVGCSYFPQSRVDCHYTLSSKLPWASNDWIGLFKVGWSSVRDYHTFVWSSVPADNQEGRDVNCCVQFQASYLPRPSSEEYQFVYVDSKGEVCSRSPAFTFGAPEPLEELVTLEEGGPGEEGSTDMLLVVPRAELLQSRLQACLQERAELLQAQEGLVRKQEREEERYARARVAWETERRELKRTMARLQDELHRSQDSVVEMELRQKEEQALGDYLVEQQGALLALKEAGELRIRELEEDIKTLAQRAADRETELDRFKERTKRSATQKKEEDTEKKDLQTKLEHTEAELRTLAKEFQVLRSSLAQRDTSVLQLQNTISTLTHKLTTAHRKETESEAALKDMRGLRERLSASERTVDGLKADLSATVTKRDHGQAEVHQARLQAAQLTLQLADSSLAFREARAHWAQEQQHLQHTAEKDCERLEKVNVEFQRTEEQLQEERMEREKVEVELGREKDCNRVQLSEARRELQELKASVRVAQKEKEQLLAEKKDLREYIRMVEQKMGLMLDPSFSTASVTPAGRPYSPLSDSEEESPEAQPPPPAPPSPGPLAHYSLCEQGQLDPLLPATPPPSLRELARGTVVISQPAPLSAPRQASTDAMAHSSESEEGSEVAPCASQSTAEETAPLLPEHTDAIFSDLAHTSLW